MTAHKSISDKLIDLVGNRYDHLTVLEYAGDLLWVCECDCGNIVYLKGQKLREAKRWSCGCQGAACTRIGYKGAILSFKEISQRTGIILTTLRNRYRLGLRGEELFKKPHRGKQHRPYDKSPSVEPEDGKRLKRHPLEVVD